MSLERKPDDQSPSAEKLFELGTLHMYGAPNASPRIVPSISKGMHYYKQAAKAGHAGAAYELGIIYEKGTIGVEPNIPKAVAYFKDAGRLEHTKALIHLGRLYLEHYGEVLQAKNCYELAALYGDPCGFFFFAQLYEKGYPPHVPHDSEESLKNFREAARCARETYLQKKDKNSVEVLQRCAKKLKDDVQTLYCVCTALADRYSGELYKISNPVFLKNIKIVLELLLQDLDSDSKDIRESALLFAGKLIDKNKKTLSNNPDFQHLAAMVALRYFEQQNFKCAVVNLSKMKPALLTAEENFNLGFFVHHLVQYNPDEANGIKQSFLLFKTHRTNALAAVFLKKAAEQGHSDAKFFMKRIQKGGTAAWQDELKKQESKGTTNKPAL